MHADYISLINIYTYYITHYGHSTIIPVHTRRTSPRLLTLFLLLLLLARDNNLCADIEGVADILVRDVDRIHRDPDPQCVEEEQVHPSITR